MRTMDGVTVDGTPLRDALLPVWLVTAAVGVSTVVAPLLVPEAILLQASAALQAPDHVPGSCALCGMTRAFLAIARGDFGAAADFNRGAIPLAGVFLANAAAAATFALRRARSAPHRAPSTR